MNFTTITHLPNELGKLKGRQQIITEFPFPSNIYQLMEMKCDLWVVLVTQQLNNDY